MIRLMGEKEGLLTTVKMVEGRMDDEDSEHITRRREMTKEGRMGNEGRWMVRGDPRAGGSITAEKMRGRGV